MTKKTFLKKLEAKLEGLDEKKINRIMKKYERIIDDEIASGKAEKDVIASLGDIDLIVKLNTTNDDEEVKKEKKKENSNTKMKWTDYTLKFVDDAFSSIDDKVAKRILLIICFVAIAFIFATLLHIPFRILEFIGLGIFSVVFDHLFTYEAISAVWVVGLNICYAITVIWLIVQYVQAIISKYSDIDIIKSVKREKNTKDEKIIKEESKLSKTNDFLDVIFIILKVFVIILTIPFVFAEIGLVIAFIFLISLIIQGISVFGPALLMLGLIMLFGSLLDIIYTSLSKRGGF